VSGALALVAAVLPALAPLQRHDAILQHHPDDIAEVDHAPVLMRQLPVAASSRDVTVALTGNTAYAFAGSVTPSTTISL
jgi:hypothetical protein